MSAFVGDDANDLLIYAAKERDASQNIKHSQIFICIYKESFESDFLTISDLSNGNHIRIQKQPNTIKISKTHQIVLNSRMTQVQRWR